MKIGEALRKIRDIEGPLKKDLVQTILNDEKTSKMVFLRYIEEPLSHKKKDSQLGIIYAYYFLTYFEDSKVLDILMESLNLGNEEINYYFNHRFFGADVGNIIALNAKSDDVHKLLENIIDIKYKGYRYRFVLDALKLLWAYDVVDYEEITKRLHQAFLEFDDSYRLNQISEVLVAINDSEFFKEIAKKGKSYPLSVSPQMLLKKKHDETRDIAKEKILLNSFRKQDIPSYLTLNEDEKFKRIINKEGYGIGSEKIIYKCLKCGKEFFVSSKGIEVTSKQIDNLEIINKPCVLCEKDSVPLIFYNKAKSLL